jgi:hypothetical protein
MKCHSRLGIITSLRKSYHFIGTIIHQSKWIVKHYFKKKEQFRDMLRSVPRRD